MNKSILMFILFSNSAWGDAGCHSAISSASCFIWWSILVIGISFGLWTICLPILLALDFYLGLKKNYKVKFLTFSFFELLFLVLLLSSDQYQHFWRSTIFDNVRKYDVWIITFILYSLTYLSFYFHQKKYAR